MTVKNKLKKKVKHRKTEISDTTLKVVSLIIAILIVLNGAVILSDSKFLKIDNNEKKEIVKKEEKVIKIATIGDSITEGSKNLNYSIYLNDILKEEKNKYKVINYGVSGTTIRNDISNSYMGTEAYKNSLKEQADIYTVMLGTNDVFKNNWVNKDKFKEDYRKLIDSYVNLKNKPIVYLCTPPSYQYANKKKTKIIGEGRSVKRYNKVVEAVNELAEEYNLKVIDIFDFTSNHVDWFVSDGVHITEVGYQNIANKFYEGIMENGVESDAKDS